MSEIPYTVVRSARKTAVIEVKYDGQVIVRVPKRYPNARIQEFVYEKRAWIEKSLLRMEQKRRLQEKQNLLHPVQKLTEEELKTLMKEALEDLPKRAEKYAPVVGVTYGRITIRCQKTKWGSCSSKGNLNFNCLLMRAPEFVRDYVVIHELCHRREMNHSVRFWAEVRRVMPEYERAKRWLKDNGGALMQLVY